MTTERGQAAAEATPLGERPLFEGGLHDLGDGAYAWLQPNGGLGESNAGLIVGDGASVLVDTLWDERLTRRMLDAMRPVVERAPIGWVLNTHGDGDHWYGNGAVGDVEVIATESAAAQMRGEPPTMLVRMAPLPRLAGLVAALPLVPRRSWLRGLARFGDQLSQYEFEGIEPRLPDLTFSGELQLNAGGRRVEAIEVGPAHTTGDAIVWLPDARIAFVADIVFSGVTPIVWAGPASNWIAALERIERLEPRAVVPGHGPICDLERLRELRDYWRWLGDRVGEDGGSDPGRLARELIGSDGYRSAPWGAWGAPERTLVNAAILAREREGDRGPLGTRKRIALLASMGALGEELEAGGQPR